VVEPEVAEVLEREVVSHRLGEAYAVDPARRGAGDDVHDHARPELLAVPLSQLLQQPAVDALALRGLSFGSAGIQQRRALDEPVQLLGDAVHVDRERGTSVTDQREAKLLRGDGGHERRLFAAVGDVKP